MLNNKQLRIRFIAERKSRKMSLRAVEAETGVGFSRLSYFENGGDLDTHNFVPVAAWLGIDINEKVVRTVPEDNLAAMCDVIRADTTIGYGHETLCEILTIGYNHFTHEMSS